MNNKNIVKKKIGIIGLGVMGGKIADKYLKKGYQLYVYDINPHNVNKYTNKGALSCKTVKDLTKKSELIIEITPDDKTSKSVWLGKSGILSGASNNKIFITCATLSVEWVDRLAKKCRDLGYTYFDIGLTSGYRGPTLLCGGDIKKLEEIKPYLRIFAGKILYFGKHGQGIRCKLILNFMQAAHRISMAQALQIAKHQHMDISKVGNSIVDKIGGNITFTAWEDYKLSYDRVSFTVELMTKDLNYVKEMTKGLDVSMVNTVIAEYKKAISRGYAKKDFSIINTPEYIR